MAMMMHWQQALDRNKPKGSATVTRLEQESHGVIWIDKNGTYTILCSPGRSDHLTAT